MILEKLSSVGKKILATGNGRCNLTNENLDLKFFHSQNREFLRYAIENFNLEKTIKFFNSILIETTNSTNGKIFPLTMQSSTVVDLLRDEIDELGVITKTNSKVLNVDKKNGKFIIEIENGLNIQSDFLLIATGGKSASHLGSSGDGYQFARKFGHTITPLLPSLVQLKSDENYLKKIDGVKFEGIISLHIDNQKIQEVFGDILFRKDGISGNSVLDISRYSSKGLSEKKVIEVYLNLMPSFDNPTLDKLLIKRFELKPKKMLSKSLLGLINKKLIFTILQLCQIEDKPVANIAKKERKKIVNQILEWRLPINNTAEFKRAEVTIGGVDVGEIDPKTMESKLIKNLYFSGEVLDVDGDCGGYNLQWAWSSGYLAGNLKF